MSEPSERRDVLNEMRELMGTQPRRAVEPRTEFVRGGERVTARLVSGHGVNWYKGMFVMATATWGGPEDSGVDKWNRASVEARQQVVLAVLQRKALPLALEHPQFLFEVTGCSRSAYDQLARARVGVTIASMGVRDNAHADAAVVLPPHVYDDDLSFRAVASTLRRVKRTYSKMLKQGHKSYQDARVVLPMGLVHRFCLNINYAALATLCANRLKFCEQYDTVAVAWKLRQALGRHYALLATALRPSCDFAKRCTYHEAYSLSEAFGCLFRGCGRWPDPYEYTEFNESAAERTDVEAWLGEAVPDGDDPVDWTSALTADRRYFEES